MATKRVVVLVDLSETSGKLLMFANDLAIESGIELWVVHQTFSFAPALGDAEIRSGIDLNSRREALKKLSAYVADAGVNGNHISYHVTTNNLDGAILNLKAMGPDDVIVVGVRAKGWLQRLLMQGTAVKLVNAVQNTIIALPDVSGSQSLSKLYVAIKPDYPLNHEQLRNLALLDGQSGKPIHFLSVPSSGEDTETLLRFLKSQCDIYGDIASVSFEILPTGNTLSGIRQYMQDKEGMLVVQRGSRNFLDIFRKYFATDLIHDAQIPTIILP